jgi:methylamine dehydrogenase accessory protein MauD
MKKSIIISLIALQALTLVGVATTAYFTFMNKARIRATQRVMVDTQEQLGTTFEFMNKVAEQTAKAEDAKLPLAEGSEAPAFALKDENSQEVKLEDYKGKKTLLVFSQEACPYCKDFYPVLNEFQAQKEDINIVVMQIGSTPEQNKKYKQKENITAPLLAASYEQLTAYKIQSTPTSVLLDEEGKVLGTKTVASLEELTSFVKDSCKDCQVKS